LSECDYSAEVEMRRAEREGKIGTMEQLVALTIVVVIVAFAAVYALAALKGRSKPK
jgi:hypothetical protein